MTIIAAIMPGTTWEQVAKEAQAHRQASIDCKQFMNPGFAAAIQDSTDSLDQSGLPKRVLYLEELEITESLPEDLISALAEQRCTAVNVTKAFLNRAVLAQYAVSVPSLLVEGKTYIHRPIALLSSFPSEPLSVPATLTASSSKTERSRVLCTVFPLVSKNTLA